jgi:hypothetical protein
MVQRIPRNIVLALEIMEKRPFGHPGLGTDFVHRGGAKTAAAHERDPGLQEFQLGFRRRVMSGAIQHTD